MVCPINIQSACANWDEPIKKVCNHEQKNLGSYLLNLITYTHLLVLNLPTYPMLGYLF
jgi:hypothetical protein